jgi:hypothetical protein
MTTYERGEFVRCKLVEQPEVLIKTGREIKSGEGSIARGYAIDRHHEFGFGNVDEKIAFVGMVKVATQFNRLAPESDLVLRLKRGRG